MKRGQGWNLNLGVMLWVIIKKIDMVRPQLPSTIATTIVVTFLISLSDLSLLVDRNARDFCVVTF